MNYHIDADGTVTFLAAGHDPQPVEGREAELVCAHACVANRAGGITLPWDDGADVPEAGLEDAYKAAYEGRAAAMGGGAQEADEDEEEEGDGEE